MPMPMTAATAIAMAMHMAMAGVGSIGCGIVAWWVVMMMHGPAWRVRASVASASASLGRAYVPAQPDCRQCLLCVPPEFKLSDESCGALKGGGIAPAANTSLVA